MEGYKVTIVKSSKELTARERLYMKDTSNAVKLDEVVTPESTLVITPTGYCVLAIHNEQSENKDYEVYVIVDENGTKYVTGSESFWQSFDEIYSEMAGEEETYSIDIRKIESKNYKGKYFLTCSII